MSNPVIMTDGKILMTHFLVVNLVVNKSKQHHSYHSALSFGDRPPHLLDYNKNDDDGRK